MEDLEKEFEDKGFFKSRDDEYKEYKRKKKIEAQEKTEKEKAEKEKMEREQSEREEAEREQARLSRLSIAPRNEPSEIKDNSISEIDDDVEIKRSICDLADPYAFTEFDDSFMALPPRLRSRVEEFAQSSRLTKGFDAHDLMDIFEDHPKPAEHYEASPGYNGHEALQDTFDIIRSSEYYFLNSRCKGRVVIIYISPAFEAKKKLLQEYRTIVRSYCKNQRELYIAVSEDSHLFGTTDLYVRIFKY